METKLNIKTKLDNLSSDFTRKGDKNLNSVSELSVRGTQTCSEFVSVASENVDIESFAETSFAGDAGNDVKDLCAICYDNPSRKITFASLFCHECGLLGRFICENCSKYHKKFTNHKDVRSLKAAAAKANVGVNEQCRMKAREHINKENDTYKDNSTQTDNSMDTTVMLETQRTQIIEKTRRIKELEIQLKRTEIQSKKLSFEQQLTENK